ncbi:uncharacterized protein TNCV_2684571 [Trichonephila clavipes]|nr:uncharacterized protein TNCV_2684571 [Trichonephila clavipes]
MPHYEQLSEFERGRIIEVKETGWANRRIARHMSRSDVAIRRCWQEWVESGKFQHHDARSDWNPADWGPIVFSNESRFQLCPDDHRGCVWRSPGQRADPAFTIACRTGPQPGVIVWGAIFLTAGPLWSSLEHTSSQRFVDDILRTVLLPFF